MLLLPVFLALATQTAPALTIAGKTIPIVPTPVPPVLAQEVSGWSGWGPFTGDFQGLSSATLLSEQVLATPLASDAVDWHLKIAIFPTSDVVDKQGSVVRSYRSFWADPQLNATLQAVARMPGSVAAATGGKVRLILDASVESDPARDTITGTDGAFGPVWLEKYFGPRINGGRYEAEDRVFRGPYPSAILVIPGSPNVLSSDLTPSISAVNGTPVTVASLRQDGQIDGKLFNAWLETAKARSALLGYGGTLGGEVPWKDLASGDPPSIEDAQRLESHRDPAIDTIPVPYQAVTSRVGAGSKVEIVTDTDRGPVLRLSESGPERVARVSLPALKEPLGGDRIFTFWYRSESKEPIAITFISKPNGTRALKLNYFSLGRDRRSANIPPAVELDVPSDGKWHKVGIDLNTATPDGLGGIEIGPSFNAIKATDTAIVPPSWDFASFALEKDGATPLLPAPKANLISTDAEDRLMALSGTTAANLATALTDPNADVRLTAASLLLEKPEPAAATALLAAANTIDADLARVAVQAYAKLDMPDEREQLLRLLKFGVTGMAKSEAAFALTETKDPKLAGEIMNLLANRSGEVRRAAADALGLLPGREPGIIRTAFLRQEDPSIKLSVTMSADGSDEAQAGKLRWSAVNEPSDMVRLWSAIRLIPSTLPEARKDGYGVVRDESVFVRMKLVEWMGEHPNEAHRPSLRLALTDKSPLVRAAAVVALKKQAVGPTPEELKPVINDPDPRVRGALGT
ncbi:hypothetical protein BH11ARM2_BH11ARM2_14380 [soil metagenome]